MEAKGNQFLKVMSILMIIGGTGGIIVGVSAVLGASALAAEIGNAANFGLLMFASIVAWASGVTGLIAGATGIKNAAKPEKTMAGIVFGILTVTLSILGSILNAAGGGSFSVVNLITGLVLPVLYLIGAF